MGNAVRRTYEPGQFSQVNLPDGTKVLISTGRSDIRVTKLGFLNLPVGVIWKFDFGVPIQTDPARPPEHVKSAMDAIVCIVEGCETLAQAQRKLSADGVRLLATAVAKGSTPEEQGSLKSSYLGVAAPEAAMAGSEKPNRVSINELAQSLAGIILKGTKDLKDRLREKHLVSIDQESPESFSFWSECLLFEWFPTDVSIAHHFKPHGDAIRDKLMWHLYYLLHEAGMSEEDVDKLNDRRENRFSEYAQALKSAKRREDFPRLGSLAWKHIVGSEERSPAGGRSS